MNSYKDVDIAAFYRFFTYGEQIRKGHHVVIQTHIYDCLESGTKVRFVVRQKL